MNNNYKYLVWAGTGVLVVLAVFLMVMIDHVSNTATNTNTVSFSGEGRVFAKPDVAVISFSIVTEAATSEAAQDSNSQKSNKVVDFLKNQDIDEKDIKTSGYNVYPQYSSSPCPLRLMEIQGTEPSYYPDPGCRDQSRITGYQVTQSFEVKIRDLDKVSSILDGLVAQGANQVNNLGFQIDDLEKVKDEARELAIKDAKEKASILKKQIGIRLGKIINYYEGGGYPMYYEAKAMDGRGGLGGGAAPGPSVPAGENEIVVSVTLTYQIK